jgi:hypothetical protein
MSCQTNQKYRARKSAVQKSATPIFVLQLETSKWVKLGTLFENENLDAKIYFNREENLINKKAKRRK